MPPVILTDKPPGSLGPHDILGEVSGEAPGGFLRGATGLAREVEDSLRRAGAALGATHVADVTIHLRPRLISASARGRGIALRLREGGTPATDLPEGAAQPA